MCHEIKIFILTPFDNVNEETGHVAFAVMVMVTLQTNDKGVNYQDTEPVGQVIGIRYNIIIICHKIDVL